MMDECGQDEQRGGAKGVSISIGVNRLSSVVDVIL